VADRLLLMTVLAASVCLPILAGDEAARAALRADEPRHGGRLAQSHSRRIDDVGWVEASVDMASARRANPSV
jgi:hypothetical protein